MIIEIHPEDPQGRRVDEVVSLLQNGEIIALPTDTSYALCCKIGAQSAMDQILQIREADRKKHYFSLMCRDLSELSHYAQVDNRQFRLLKAILPGPYTLILKGTREVPKRLMMPSRNSVGLRVPDHKIMQSILEQMGEPLLVTTLKLPNVDSYELSEVYEIDDLIGKRVAAVVDGGGVKWGESSVIDLTSGNPEVVRVGLGSVDLFE